jgi:voltage-gated potassium channel
MEKIRLIINDPTTGAGKVFALFIQFMILLSLATFSYETLPDLSTKQRELLATIEAITIGIFSTEYILRVYFAENRRRFIFSFYGVVDLISIVPFYLPASVDLRAIRILRVLRLLRIFKMMRYNEAVSRFARALVIAKEELILFLVVTVLILYISAVGIYYFENPVQPEQFQSVFHSLWWALITLTTVGYGDMYPITAGGRVFTFLILMIGLGVIAVPTGILASALAKTREEGNGS